MGFDTATLRFHSMLKSLQIDSDALTQGQQPHIDCQFSSIHCSLLSCQRRGAHTGHQDQVLHCRPKRLWRPAAASGPRQVPTARERNRFIGSKDAAARQ